MSMNRNRIDRIFYYSLLVLAFTIPLSQYLSTRILVVIFLFALWRGSFRLLLARAWDSLLYFAILAGGLLITKDTEHGLRVLETSLSLIGIPMVLSTLDDVDDSRVDALAISFSGGLCIASIGIVVNSGWKYLETGSTSAFLFKELTDVLDFQPTYFAYFLVFAITFGLYQFFYRKSFLPSWLTAIALAGLFGVLILTGGRTAFIGILLTFSFFILKFILEKQTREHLRTFVLVIGMMAALFTASFLSEGITFSDSWERFDLWTSAIGANDNVLFGVGTGDDRQALNDFYLTNGFSQFADDNLNAHNQFLHSYLSNGIIGLCALLILLTRPLYLAFQNNHPLTILVLFPFLIYGMTEVFLGRYQGVIFYSFLHQVFVAHLLSSSSRVVSGISK